MQCVLKVLHWNSGKHIQLAKDTATYVEEELLFILLWSTFYQGREGASGRVHNYTWYIPSEKVGQFFWPPKNVFFAIHFQYWTSGNAFWPFLAHPAPWGVSGGVGGGQGGSVGPKFSNFFGATFGFQNAKFWIVWTENTPFSSFLAKFSPSGDQKCPFWAEMVEHKSAFFSKTSSLNCLKMHQNKVLGSILI